MLLDMDRSKIQRIAPLRDINPRFRRKMISHFVASNEHAAEVIGRKGWKIKEIASKTNTRIKCPTPDGMPVFQIFGQKINALKAKRLITAWANNFDHMKTKKRSIRWTPGDVVDTVLLHSSDVSTVIGRKGKQVKTIAETANAAIVSPDINKEPIFIVSGKEANVSAAIFWIKLTAFCVNETNHFTQHNILLIRRLLDKYDQNIRCELTRNTGKIVNLKKLREKFPSLINETLRSRLNGMYETTQLTVSETFTASYYCWCCKQTKYRIAIALCGHVLCCDLCIVQQFKDFYLQCSVCKSKVDNFLIEAYDAK